MPPPVLFLPAPRTKIPVAHESIWESQHKAPAPNRGAALKAHTSHMGWGIPALRPTLTHSKRRATCPPEKDQRARPCGLIRWAKSHKA